MANKDIFSKSTERQNIKVTAIIPAYNEEKTITDVLKIITGSPSIDETIVVNDGSTDKTVQVIKGLGFNIRLLNNKENMGKGFALYKGARAAKNSLLLFCDADLTGLKQEHLKQLIEPVKEGRVDMVVGVQEKLSFLQGYSWGQKILPSGKKKSSFISALGGEKVLWKKDFLEINRIGNSGYRVEQIIVNFFLKNKKNYKNLELADVGHVWKVKKWGLKGVLKEIVALAVFAKQYIQFEILKSIKK